METPAELVQYIPELERLMHGSVRGHAVDNRRIQELWDLFEKHKAQDVWRELNTRIKEEAMDEVNPFRSKRSKQ